MATLVDPSRRALYDYVRRQDHPVGREEAAEATAMSRGLAAFHLDKLVEAGLLTARYEAPAGRPRGRGRAPKVYEPTGDGLAVTIPERQYELIADILAEAVVHRAGAGGDRLPARARPGRTDAGSGRLPETLAGLGFEPHAEAGVPAAAQLPVPRSRRPAHRAGVRPQSPLPHRPARRSRRRPAEARLAPRPGACCVELLTPRPR